MRTSEDPFRLYRSKRRVVKIGFIRNRICFNFELPDPMVCLFEGYLAVIQSLRKGFPLTSDIFQALQDNSLRNININMLCKQQEIEGARDSRGYNWRVTTSEGSINGVSGRRDTEADTPSGGPSKSWHLLAHSASRIWGASPLANP